jgi:methylated-DNA-[protein]-cysteine S-methyltransferase
MELELSECESPIGLIRAVVGADGLCDLDFTDRWEIKRQRLERRFGSIDLVKVADASGVVSRLRAYFDGHLEALDPFPVDPGGTPFQRKVWSALRAIPVGTTTSYGALAAKVGVAGGARPVGTANGRNPIAIVVPCHRVIGADGSLTGYAGGLARKRWLLAHEGALSTMGQLTLGDDTRLVAPV